MKFIFFFFLNKMENIKEKNNSKYTEDNKNETDEKNNTNITIKTPIKL